MAPFFRPHEANNNGRVVSTRMQRAGSLLRCSSCPVLFFFYFLPPPSSLPRRESFFCHPEQKGVAAYRGRVFPFFHFEVDDDSRVSVRSEKHVDDLLSCPQLQRFENAGRGQVDMYYSAEAVGERSKFIGESEAADHLGDTQTFLTLGASTRASIVWSGRFSVLVTLPNSIPTPQATTKRPELLFAGFLPSFA